VLTLIEIYSQNFNDLIFAIALNQQELVASTFSRHQKTALCNIRSNLPFETPFQVFQQPTTHAKTILAASKDIYDGKDSPVKFKLATRDLTIYTQKVLKATIAIPVGYITSYGAIAKAVGGGARVVGNAMARNRFPPIVPCHRVVKSNLSLGGYSAGGLRVKLDFLMREQRGFHEPKKIATNGGVLSVFPVEHVLQKYV